MKNFRRVLQLSLAYPMTIVGIAASALLVAILWGANIGVVYPFVEVVFEGQPLQHWVDRKIEEAEKKQAELDAALAALPAVADRATHRQRGLLESRRDAEASALASYRKIKPLIDRYMPSTPFRTLLILVAGLMIGTIIKDTMLVVDIVLVERLVQLTLLDLRKLCFRTSLDMDMKSFGEHSTPTLLSRFTTDSNAIAQGMTQLYGTSVREPLKMIACLAGASFICWRLLLFSLLLAPPAAYLMKRLSQSIKRANRRALEEMQTFFHTVTEAFNGIQTVKAYTMERHERNRFHRVVKQLFHKAMKITFYNALTKPITEMLGIGVISLALVSGAYLVLNQETHLLGIKMSDRPLSVASLLVFYGLLAGVSDPARKMTDIYGSLQGALAASDRLFALLDVKPTIADPAHPHPAPRPFQELEIRDVTFAYNDRQPVLRNVDLRIRAGETIAIVGPNGCGKTTLINLLPRFYDPTDGAILLDGVDLRNFRLRDLRQQIGLVTQQTQIFNDSVMNNIRYGSPDATDERVIEAAKKAHAHGFITEKLEQGYATIVGQGGNRLSGGQRQRIALARAILRDPAILILDEATSQVDLESEHLIHRVLEKFIVGRTAIMITHRLSTLSLADRILVMDHGHIVDCGTHDELFRRCDVYRRVHEIQFRQTA